MKLVARDVRPDERTQWDDLARENGDLFLQPSWVDALGSEAVRIGIFDPGNLLVGGFVVRRYRRAGIPVFSNAPFCQGAGPFWKARTQSVTGRLEERRSVVEAMAAFLEPGVGVTLVRLSGTVEDVMPFRWRGFRTNVEYTYRLGLERPGEAFLPRYDGKTRNDIRKAVRDGLIGEVGQDFDEVEILQRSALERAGAGGGASISAVIAYARKAPGAFTVTVRGPGPSLAASLVLISGDTAYYVMGGHRRDQGKGSHHGAGALAIHTSILEAGRCGCRVFDFEGSTIPRVEPFIRGFGGTLTPYYSAAKAWLPIECVLKLRYRGLF